MGSYREEEIQSDLIPLSGGIAGTEETIIYMQRLALQGSRLEKLRGLAEHLVRSLPARDYAAEAVAVENWVRAHLRFTRDGLLTETLKTPERMLNEVAAYSIFTGDCDDASILVAALLLALGHAPAFQVLGRGKMPHHVNVIDRTSGQVLDPTGNPAGAFGYVRAYDVVPVGA